MLEARIGDAGILEMQTGEVLGLGDVGQAGIGDLGAGEVEPDELIGNAVDQTNLVVGDLVASQAEVDADGVEVLGERGGEGAGFAQLFHVGFAGLAHLGAEDLLNGLLGFAVIGSCFDVSRLVAKLGAFLNPVLE